MPKQAIQYTPVKTTYREVAHLISNTWNLSCVIFSIFENIEFSSDPAKWRIATPDLQSTIPMVKGPCKITIDYWRVADEKLTSETINSPTWKDILTTIDKMLASGDGQGVFLENLYCSKEGDITILEACIGS